MEDLFSIIPRDFFDFLIISVFSLIIGLSQKAMHASHITPHDSAFGTDRTFTFIGMLGYIFWIVEPTHQLYILGVVILAVLLSINYFQKIKLYNDFGLTTIVVALLTYSFAALLKTQPVWLFLLVFVTLLIIAELKDNFNKFSKQVNREEFITLGKFLAIAGIILPIVPDKPIVSFIDLTPYKIWLAVVVISSISYLSYLLRKFVYKDAGVLVTGILGGLYSSTATTVVHSRSSTEAKEGYQHFVSGIILSVAMMYLRIALLMAIFNISLFYKLWPWFLLMALTSAAIALAILYYKSDGKLAPSPIVTSIANPLEFRIAIIFTVLYVVFSFITYFTIKEYGTNGLQVLAYAVGITDIDPFLLNLFSGKFNVGLDLTAIATLQALFSNNLLKLVYSLFLSNKSCKKYLLIGFSGIIIVNLLLIFLV
jgi:uncharacterized membrane protein (DUF4010 family)